MLLTTEKLNKEQDSKNRILPNWISIRYSGKNFNDTVDTLQDLRLNTICDESLCPNKSECFSNGVATFMLLGKICTRNCRYCHVKVGKPLKIDNTEPIRVATAIQRLQLKYVVITSVNRDDLQDGGASIFKETATQIKRLNHNCDIEFLIPDFKGKRDILQEIVNTPATVIGHNIETVKRLFHTLRPQGDYNLSLSVLKKLKEIEPSVKTKSGLMIGLGENEQEIVETMQDLQEVGCDFLTIGQYLQPSPQHAKVIKYYNPYEFLGLKNKAEKMGFKHVESGPLVRSSYRADKSKI